MDNTGKNVSNCLMLVVWLLLNGLPCTTYAQNTENNAQLFHCQYSLNGAPFQTSSNCTVNICRQDDLVLRLTSISEPASQAKFHIWRSPGGRLDYGSIRLLKDESKYGRYRVNLVFDGKRINKTFDVGKKKEKVCKDADPSVVGFWWGPDRRFDAYFDINHHQIIVRENKSAAECPVRFLFSYNQRGDTLILNNGQYQNLRLLVDFKTPNNVHLSDIDRRGFLMNQTIVLNRFDGAICDCPEDYIMPIAFLKRPWTKEAGFMAWVVIYVGLFFKWLTLYKADTNFIVLSKYWMLMGLTCLLFSFSKWWVYLLFPFHFCTLFSFLLKKWTLLNSIGKVAFYGIATGLFLVLEFIIVYGFNTTAKWWFTPTPLISVIAGIGLIHGFVRDGVAYSNFRVIQLYFIGFLFFGLVQGYVASQKDTIVEWVAENVSIGGGSDDEKCPGLEI